MTRTLVTGAAGFLGQAMVRQLLKTRAAGDVLILTDRSMPLMNQSGVETISADIADTGTLAPFVEGVDCVIHLAGVLGGAAESDYELSRRINLLATLDLMKVSSRAQNPRRFVYASSVAVFGDPLPPFVDDDTMPRPSMNYGAHKLMVEIELANLARRGVLDGVALRLPGIVARPRGAAGLKSAFMSDVFHAASKGEHYILPVGREATMWLMLAATAAYNIGHAATIAPPPGPRAFTLPALHVRMDILVAAIAKHAGTDPAAIAYEPDAILEKHFGRLPPLATPLADSLGFRHDGDIAALVDTVQRALSTAG